ncbi:MAG TPA: GNAT family N-acetyltransferase [Bacteroidota bacterium]|nr:GNAT family N-acetyltransferase [Bacteroidota bacterium]
MDIRTATPSDTEELARLYAISFPAILKTHDEWCSELQPNARRSFNDMIVASEGGRIAGALSILPQSLFISGVEMKCGGIAGVAVLPEFRLRGIAHSLMMDAFNRMRSQQIFLSLLYPFKRSFYQKLGYGLIGDLQTMTISSAVIPRFSERDDVHPLIDHELSKLIACYDIYVRRNNCCIMRSADVWKQELKRAHKNRWTYWCHHAEGTITGYMLIEEKDQVTVKELVYLTPQALRGLLGFLAVYKTHSPLLIPFVRDEFFHLLLTDAVDVSNTPLFGLYPLSGRFGHGLMLRVADVTEALRRRKFNTAVGSVTFHIVDDQIDQNSMTLSIEFKGDAVNVNDGVTTHLISLTISTFAQLYTGYLPFTAAQKAGLIDAYFDVTFLDDAFALPAPHCLDFF